MKRIKVEELQWKAKINGKWYGQKIGQTIHSKLTDFQDYIAIFSKNISEVIKKI